jgi:hypothetical protein
MLTRSILGDLDVKRNPTFPRSKAASAALQLILFQLNYLRRYARNMIYSAWKQKLRLVLGLSFGLTPNLQPWRQTWNPIILLLSSNLAGYPELSHLLVVVDASVSRRVFCVDGRIHRSIRSMAPPYLPPRPWPQLPLQHHHLLFFHLPGSSQGCWVDGVKGRILTYQQPDNPANTIEACISTCSAGNYTVAGLEYGVQSFCDTIIRSGGTNTSDSQCNFPCSGDSDEICGAGNCLSIYSLGH